MKVLPGRGKILLMDDDEMFRELSVELLTHLGYRVTCVGDGSEALKTYAAARESGDRFDAVIIDLTVPGGMGGRDTVDHLRRIDPLVKAIVSTGYADDPMMADYERYGFSAAIPKPFNLNALTRTLARVTE